MAAAGSGGSNPDYWIMTMGGDETESGAGVDVDSQNNIVLGTRITSGTDKYAGLHKLDQHGNVLWEYTVENQFTGTNSGPINESFNGIAIDKDTDDIYAVGGCHGLNPDSDQAGYLAKFNSEGSLLFDRYLYCTEFATPSRAIVFTDVNLDPSKNIIIAGTRNGQYGTACQLSVKYDTQGLLVYAGGITSGASDTRAGNSVANYNNSLNFFDFVYRTSGPGTVAELAKITRQSGSTGTPTHNATALMGSSTYNAYTGDIHYRNIPGIPAMLAAASTISTNATATSLGRLHGMVSAFDAGLVNHWNYEIDINTNYYDTWLYAVARDSVGNFIVAGNTNYDVGLSNSPSNLVVLKLDYYGNLVWSRIIQNASYNLEGKSIYFQNASNAVNSTNNSTVSKIAIDNNDDIIITATVSDNAIGNQELFVAKLPGDGSGTGTYTTTNGTQAFEYIDYQFRDPTTIPNTAIYGGGYSSETWSTVSNDATSGNPAMLVSTHQSLRADRDEIPAPAIVTGNQEQTWSQANTGASIGNWRTIESLDNGITVVAGASGEIAITNGATLDQWSTTVTNATDAHNAMAVNANNLVVAGGGAKVYTCPVNNVGAFTSRTTGSTNTISHLASNRDGTYVLASFGYDQYTQILRSSDSGASWSAFNADITYKISSVGMDPGATASSGRRFAYTNHTTNNNRTILTQPDNGSADTSSPWQYNEPIYPIAMSRNLNVRPATKLHSTGVADGVLCGTQWGIMWYPWDSANGTPQLYGVGGQVRGLAYNPNTDTWLAVSPLTSTQLFKASGTDLTKWTPVETNITFSQTPTANILTYNSTLDKFIIAGYNEVYYTS